MSKEIKALNDNNAEEIMSIPQGKKPIDCN